MLQVSTMERNMVVAKNELCSLLLETLNKNISIVERLNSQKAPEQKQTSFFCCVPDASQPMDSSKKTFSRGM